MSDVMALVSQTKEGIEISPLDENGEALLNAAREQQVEVKLRTEAPVACPLDPEVPEPLSICAAIREVDALRAGEIDSTELTERLLNWGVMRSRLKRGKIESTTRQEK